MDICIAADHSILFFCGMQTELKKREKEADNKILIHLVIWYAVVILLMNMNDSGWIIGIAVLATYIGILVELKHTAENLEKAGYVLEEPPMRVSNGKCAAGAVVLTAAGLVIGIHILWFLPYEMERGESTAGSGIRGDKNASGFAWISGGYSG